MKKILTLGMVLLASATLSACAVNEAQGMANEFPAQQEPPAQNSAAPSDDCIAGLEGFWNATPEDGTGQGLPRKTVTAEARTGRIIDAFNRDLEKAGSPAEVGIDYTVKPVPSAAWNSLVVIDVETGKVLDTMKLKDGERLCD